MKRGEEGPLKEVKDRCSQKKVARHLKRSSHTHTHAHIPSLSHTHLHTRTGEDSDLSDEEWSARARLVQAMLRVPSQGELGSSETSRFAKLQLFTAGERE